MIQKDPSTTSYHLVVNDLPPHEAVGQLIDYASGLPASDMIFATNDNHVAVHARVFGIVRLISILPSDLGRRCIAHVKTMSDMDASDRRLPLDGRWIFQHDDDSTIDLRVNSIPTLHGEDVCMRILSRNAQFMSVERLGLPRHDLQRLTTLLSSPSGLIIVTGPTGSGKTTSLYACLAHLSDGDLKINTIEDPVEFIMRGVRQSQINLKIGLDFPDLLRSVLRQAPDVIMVGEIRDALTAETAVRAANSGHLVLATLHASEASAAIQSMFALGVHPHFLASSLQAVLSQRLVRTLCKVCKQSYDLQYSPHTFEEVRRWLEPGQGNHLYGPQGCDKCHFEGYTGQSGIFELLTVSPAIRRLVMDRQPVQAIRQQAIEEGMIQFRQSALLKVAEGDTSVEEVFRVVPSEYLTPQG